MAIMEIRLRMTTRKNRRTPKARTRARIINFTPIRPLPSSSKRRSKSHVSERECWIISNILSICMA